MEAPRSWVSAFIFAAILLGLAGVGRGSATPADASPATAHVVAVDRVAPQPIDLVFAAPVAPAAKTVTKPAATKAAPARSTRTRALPQVRRTTKTSTNCSGDGWQQRRGQQALDSLLHPVPSGVTIAFLPGRGALKGLTYYDRHHVDVFVGSCASESDYLLRHVVAHEMGHAWDSLHMTPALRAEYMAARRIPAGTPWFGCNGCQDFATPAGDFAETYAQWQRGTSTSRTQIARPATRAELSSLARFFR